MCLVEDSIRQSRPHGRRLRRGHAKPAHRNAVDRLAALGELVRPGDITAGARREHFDVRVLGKMLGEVAGLPLRAAMNRWTVTLNDDRQLHCGSKSLSGPLSSGAEEVSPDSS